MQSCWETSVSPVPLARPSQAVAIYTAVVGLTVECSAFGINPAIERSQLIAAIESPLHWTTTPWPPYRAESQDDIKLLALERLKAFFDFAARLPNGTPDKMLSATNVRFSSTEPTQTGSFLEYSRYRVRANILTNGDPEWSYEIATSSDYPPEVRTELRQSEVDDFIQNLVRADLQRRIARRRFFSANRP